MISLRFAAAALALTAASTAADAAFVVVQPTVATASSAYGDYPAAAAIDQGPNFQNTDWAATGTGAGSFIDIDLGRAFEIRGGHIVDRTTSGGPNGTYYGGTFDYTTSFSLQAITGLYGATVGTAQTYNFATPTGPTSYASFTHDVTTARFTTRYIRYTVLATNGVNPGLSNLSFSATPEPGQWALMIGGFALVGGVVRRRRTLVAA